MNLFDQLKRITDRNGQIYRLDSNNVKRVCTGKDGWGELVVAIPNDKVMEFEDLIPVVILVHKNELED